MDEFKFGETKAFDVALPDPVEPVRTIHVQRRGHDYMAFINGSTAIWDCGKTPAEAIGRAIITHALRPMEGQ